VTFLADANVLSEPTRPRPDPNVIEWLKEHEHELAVDPVIVGELRFGILILRRGKRRARLERWFADGLARLHCIPWDVSAGLRWAQLLAELRTRGRSMPIKDSLIATTALVHGLTVATRNVRDFAETAVDVVNPFVAHDGGGL